MVSRCGRRVEALTFSILNDLEKIINHPTHIPDRHDHSPNTLDLFFISDPLHYSYTISPLIGSSEHTLVNVSLLTTHTTLTALSQPQYWHFNRADCNGLQNFYFDFLLGRLLLILG